MSRGKNTITRTISPGSVFESAKNVIDDTVSLAQGDQFYVQRGTDTTAVQLPVVEIGLQAFAPITSPS